MQQFNLDISNPRGPLVLYVSQGDSLSRFFSVTVTDNGAAYTPPDGAIYTVRFGAPGMPAGWYDTIEEPGGGSHAAVTVSGNTLTVEIAEQAVSVAGTNALVVIVSDAAGYTLASWVWTLQVAAVPGYDAPEATVYYNALTEQVAQVLSGTTAAAASATLAESWAVGGTGTRPGEDTDNAEYWASEAQRVSQGALGWYETEQALQAAHPTGTDGEWAIIGSTDTIWTWDSDTSAWVNTGNTADLSNYYTKSQADAAFATAAQGALAASAVQSVNGKTGTAVTLNPQDVGGLSTYTCTTSGTTHALTGTGNNIKFVADAAFEAGDTITVNGQAVTAQTQDGVTLAAGAWASGATVACWLNGTTLTVSGGGGSYAPPSYSTDEVLTGESWIDGKPIYRKVWSLGALSAGNYNVPKTIDIETPIACGGVAKLSRGDSWTIPSPTVSGNTNLMISVSTFNYLPENQFTVSVGEGLVGETAITSASIWVEYTKP